MTALQVRYGIEHPHFTRDYWREYVTQRRTELGYWGWLEQVYANRGPLNSKHF